MTMILAYFAEAALTAAIFLGVPLLLLVAFNVVKQAYRAIHKD